MDTLLFKLRSLRTSRCFPWQDGLLSSCHDVLTNLATLARPNVVNGGVFAEILIQIIWTIISEAVTSLAFSYRSSSHLRHNTVHSCFERLTQLGPFPHNHDP